MAALASLGSWPGARWLQGSGTAYLCVNAAHIAGIGLLLGAIVPLDLRLAGCWRHLPLPLLFPLLSRCAATGLALALLTGLWLWSVRPLDYAANPAFWAKLGLLLLALGNIVWQHGNPALARSLRDGHLAPGLRLRAVASTLLWLSVLLAGRWIGFV